MTQTPRKRPARPASLDAAELGFYSQTFTRLETDRLNTDIQGWLDDEIDLLRSLISRAAGFYLERTDLTVPENLDDLRSLTLAISRLESLYRTRKLLHRRQTALEKTLADLNYLPPEED